MKKLICFDMDGTLYLGNQLFPGVKELLKYLKEHKINYVFITNNSSKNINTYISKMKSLGIDCVKEDFYTSVDVTTKYLLQEKAKKIYAVGTQDFNKEMAKDFILVDQKTDNPEYVVLAFDRELNYTKLEKAVWFIENGAKFIATNPDLRCPEEGGRYVPDCGSMAKLITDTTGVLPKFLGKPAPDMILDLVEKFGIEKNEALVVGDRLYTDIASGYNAGVDTLAVLSGECTTEDIDSSVIKPTYVRRDVTQIYELLGE